MEVLGRRPAWSCGKCLVTILMNWSEYHLPWLLERRRTAKGSDAMEENKERGKKDANLTMLVSSGAGFSVRLEITI